MGKKSLLKSTTKKKSAAAKKKSDKDKEKKVAAKKAKAPAKSKKTAKAKPKKTAKVKPKKTAKVKPKKAASKKAASKKTAAKAKKTAVKAKAKKKAPAKKKTAAKKKPPTLKELIFEKFEPWTPETLFLTPVDESAGGECVSPPFFSAETPEEEKRIKALLFQKIDLTVPPKAAPEKEPAAGTPEPEVKAKAKKKAPAKKKAAPKKKPPTLKELIFEKFEPWTPETLFLTPVDETAGGECVSPPFFSAETPEEEKRIKALMFQKIDLTIPPKAAPEEKPAAKAPEAAPEPAVKEAEAPKTEEPQPSVSEPASAVEEKPSAVEPEADKEELKEMQDTAKKVAEAKTPEKAATEPTPRVEATTPPPKEPTDIGGPSNSGGSDPTSKMVKYAVAAFVFLIVLIVASSYSNTCKYYLVEKDGALEVWQGSFAPVGKTLLQVLPGVSAPEEAKEVYGKDDVYPFLFKFYLDKADELVDKEGWPDFDGIKANVDKALPYATTVKAREDAELRINNLKRFMFIYKANISVSKNTVAGYEAAVEYLQKAAFIASSDEEAAALKKKQESVEKTLAAMRVEEKAEAEAEAQMAKEAAKAEEAKKLAEQKEAEKEAYLKRLQDDEAAEKEGEAESEGEGESEGEEK